MKIIAKENLPNYTLPLPIYETLNIADAISRLGEEFDLMVGLDKKHVEELIAKSLDESDADLQNFTGDRRRFGEGSYEEWYKKTRTIFALIHKRTDALAAVVWFGPKSLGKKSAKFGPEEKDVEQATWHTVSVRAYPPFRGKGLMVNFVKFSLEVYKHFFFNVRFWTGMDDRNIGSVKLFTDLGFKLDPEHSDLDNDWQIMVSS